MFPRVPSAVRGIRLILSVLGYHTVCEWEKIQVLFVKNIRQSHNKGPYNPLDSSFAVYH